MSHLPIDDILPDIRAALARGTALVLEAPPGAGKTTRVPLALLDEAWLAGKKIVMLEPRRLAARAAARYMAGQLGEPVGGTVGYRVRLDTKVSRQTRVEVVTEGVLTRMLEEGQGLEGVGLLIFDEFHERSIHADLGLSLALLTQKVLRADLRLLVMSATLAGDAVARLLDDAPVIRSEGRLFSVDTRYLEREPQGWIEPAVAAAVREALARNAGDILVFLPGASEIRRTASLLAEQELDPSVQVAPLYGNLPAEAQDAAILPSREGRRKVVLATSIAETSLTIEGVRVVIDSGLMRVPRFSPRIGMTRLETVRVSKASADQRRGRAGRLGPGVCYRLWTEGIQAQLVPHGTPEILDADLAPLALSLAALGIYDPAELTWITPPPTGAFEQALELLRELGALDEHGRLTPHGRELAEFPLHPRLAHLVLTGKRLGMGGLACDLAALLSERDILRSERGVPDPDIQLRLEALGAAAGRDDQHAGYVVDRDARRRVRDEAAEWRKRLGVRGGGGEAGTAGLLLGFAYPDRIAQRRTGQALRFLLRNGRGAVFLEAWTVASSAYVVAAALDGAGQESRIFLAAALDEGDLVAHFANQIERESVVEWDNVTGSILARRRERLGAIVLRDAPLRDPDPVVVTRVLRGAVRREGLSLLPWNEAALRLRERVAFLRRLDTAWPDLSDAALLERLDEWLAPHLGGIRRRDDLARLDIQSLLLSLLTWEQRAALDELAPTHLTVPTGSRIPIDYADPAAPALAVRLQELFGLAETPRLAAGRVPLTLQLLSPANRPVQVTQDLAGFWQRSYFDVRKDLRGRYPKHYWPDDPLSAAPTRRAKPRGS